MSYAFVKLNRYIVDDEIFNNEKALKLYIWLLCKATYKESDILVGKQQVHLQKGQVVVGIKSLCKSLNISYQQLRTAVSTLKLTNKISVKSTNKFSVITILDKEIFSWKSVSGNEEDSNNQNNQSNNNKEYIDINKLRRFLFATQNKKRKTEHNYAGYDLELYKKMLNSDEFY